MLESVTRNPARWMPPVAVGIAVVAFGWGLALSATGGLSLQLFGVSVSSRDPIRPLIVAGVTGCAGLFALWRLGRLAGEPARARLSQAAVAVAMAVVGALMVKHAAFVAAGADASGYVSQAALWASASPLRVAQPLIRSSSWPDAEWTFTPLGYRPATIPGAIVPTYPPGLPALMAVARAALGESAGYAVVPILGLLAVWLVFRMAAAMAGRLEGVAAAWVFALSPTFLRQIMQPMSDVPAAALWLAALVAAWSSPGATGAAAAGVLSSLAVLVRPNLAPLALAIAFAGAVASSGIGDLRRRAVAFACGFVPGLSALLLLNRHLYGSPMASGYGSFDSLFGWEHVIPNARAYTGWIAGCETPLLALCLLAPFVVSRRKTALSTPRFLGAAAVVLATLNVLLYLAYLEFDDWSYLRFLLPALAMMYAALFAAVGALTERVDRRLRIACVCALALGLTITHVRAWSDLDVFGPGRAVRRFVEAADYVRDNTPPDAVVVCMEHSGAIRYYTNRTILRYDFIPPGRLDDAIADFERSGRRVLFVLDDWETARFRERFSGLSRYHALDWQPAKVIHEGGRVYVFAASDASNR